ncbi:MAG TPA: HNH endonuclease signature motif containing protein [Dokdonella sp.]|nr:HNH endonuclease signature motif containing protein [Dokdonella sp.]HNS27397.1 HNH endonuclease signature motif containing protein [Steroidobacteraceae bacterium]
MPRKAPTFRPRNITAPKHNPQGKQATNRQRRRAFHTGSKAWRQMREVILTRDGFVCAVCGCYGDQVDHVDGDSHNNDPSNLQTLCITDHSKKTRLEMQAPAPQTASQALSAESTSSNRRCSR